MFAATDESVRMFAQPSVSLAIHRLEAAVMTVTVATLGFPRIRPRRELKTALEGYWAGKTDAGSTSGGRCRSASARPGRASKISALAIIPSNDFSLYDHVLDTTAMVGAIPTHLWMDGRRGRPRRPISPWREARRARGP